MVDDYVDKYSSERTRRENSKKFVKGAIYGGVKATETLTILGMPFTKFLNKETTNLIRSLAEIVMDDASMTVINWFNKTPGTTVTYPDEIERFNFKLKDLVVKNLDIEKSIGRGFRDMIRGNPLRTEMLEEIRNEVMNPLREYINQEEVETAKPKDKINAELDALEGKYFSASKVR